MAAPNVVRRPPVLFAGPTRQHAAANGANSQIVIGNRVGIDGYTEVAVTAFDVNAPVASRCFQLAPFEVLTIASDVLGIPREFRGGAVISAMEWTHEVETPGGVRNLVGLAAGLVRGRSPDDTAIEFDVGSIAAEAILGPGGALTADVSCVPVPTATPTLEPPPVPTWSVMLPDVRTKRAGGVLIQNLHPSCRYRSRGTCGAQTHGSRVDFGGLCPTQHRPMLNPGTVSFQRRSESWLFD